MVLVLYFLPNAQLSPFLSLSHIKINYCQKYKNRLKIVYKRTSYGSFTTRLTHILDRDRCSVEQYYIHCEHVST